MNQQLTQIISEVLPPGCDHTDIQSPFGIVELDRMAVHNSYREGDEWKGVTDEDKQRIIVSGRVELSFHFDSELKTDHPHGSDATALAMVSLFKHWLRHGNASATLDGVDMSELMTDDG